MMKLLYVNACVNRATSRTCKLAKELLDNLCRSGSFEVTELSLEDERIPFLTSAEINLCFGLLEKGDYDNEFFRYTHQFKEADLVVIAAPFWNASFPASLKNYLEMISWPGISFNYGNDLKMIGTCKAEKMYYVTTRGGYTSDDRDLGFTTVKEHCAGLGLKEIKCISAVGLDIEGNDPEKIIAEAMSGIQGKM
jgi:FMN-dependent NADH-azoreductase